MLEILGVVLGGLLAALLIIYLVLVMRQQAHYRRLLVVQEQAIAPLAERIVVGSPERVPPFSRRLVAIPDFLPAGTFAELRQIGLGAKRSERNYLPYHKKGGTIAYEDLHASAPAVVALYHSPRLRAFVSSIVGVPIVPTPLNDQSSCSLLCYDKPGDHIGWHFDHNFYRGQHFTVLIPLVNENVASGGLSSAQLMVRLDEKEEVVPTPPNCLVVFEGAQVLHKVTGLKEGERRVILSMTYCTDPQAPVMKAVARRIKDTAFFGIRALWT